MRILFLGMDGTFSYPPLAAVLKSIRSGQNTDQEVAAVMLPASSVLNKQMNEPFVELPAERPQSELPLVQPYLSENIIHLAWANGIPVYLVQNMRNKAVQTLISSLKPDIACVACFPFIVPKSLLGIPRLGFVNIHPSLLPRHRGPAPMFWIFRSGQQDDTGVTLHWMDEGLDTGDIVSQRPISLPDGITGPEADYLCARLGGEMLVEALAQLANGQLPRRPQPLGGSYQLNPTAEDFSLDSGWSARRAYNFMRGTAEWNHPYSIQIGSQQLSLSQAKWFDANQTLPQPVVEQDGGYLIQFSPGTLLAYSFP